MNREKKKLRTIAFDLGGVIFSQHNDIFSNSYMETELTPGMYDIILDLAKRDNIKLIIISKAYPKNAKKSKDILKMYGLDDFFNSIIFCEENSSKAEIAKMTLVLARLRERIEELTALLAEKDQQAEEDKVAIANLGKSLNNALASRVQELQQFRSEFFGRLRDVLKGRDDVQIVGDRFVFQSEVLFAPGQADIGPIGQEQLAQLALALADIAAKIPDDINWVLQVDGHTDNLPVRAGRYTDNWDLSTERALSVVRFLVMQGVPAERLAATGYGEFQPLANGDTAADRRLNRRIELKITQRVAAK